VERRKHIAWHNTAIRDENDNIMGILGSGEDITEKLKLQAQLNQAQKMESIGNLAGGIAHDFNNISPSLIGFTELALDEAPKGTAIEDSLQEVYSAGNRAKDLVKQILAFARQSDEKRNPIQPSQIVEEVLKFIRSTIPTTIEIRKNIDSESLDHGQRNPGSSSDDEPVHQCRSCHGGLSGILEVSLKDVFIDGKIYAYWHEAG
jgi:two-component system cell cycle sensor histidine kinase/response regulator CckA